MKVSVPLDCYNKQVSQELYHQIHQGVFEVPLPCRHESNVLFQSISYKQCTLLLAFYRDIQFRSQCHIYAGCRQLLQELCMCTHVR
jgi:hypothetical protein